MPWLIVVLRLVHVLGGVFWGGAVFAFVLFVEPTARATGPEGSRFLQWLGGKSGYPRAMSWAGLLTIAAGLWLFWIDSGGFQREWMRQGMGIMLSVGMLAGLTAAVVGIGFGARNATRLGKLAGAVQARGGAPTPEEVATLQALQGRLRSGARVAATFLAIAVVTMAAARYVAF